MIELVVKGEVDGTTFEDSDTIRVIRTRKGFFFLAI